jgi:hypothetical protein
MTLALFLPSALGFPSLWTKIVRNGTFCKVPKATTVTTVSHGDLPTAVLKFVTLPFLAGKTQLKVINQVLCCGVRSEEKMHSPWPFG